MESHPGVEASHPVQTSLQKLCAVCRCGLVVGARTASMLLVVLVVYAYFGAMLCAGTRQAGQPARSELVLAARRWLWDASSLHVPVARWLGRSKDSNYMG
jgi:hypothetical protein